VKFGNIMWPHLNTWFTIHMLSLGNWK
jgi:hypothetical protein